MATIQVVVKHAGKKYNVDLDPASNGETFKYQLFSITGVEPERQKIIVKGGQLKDDQELSDLGIKAGHQFMMMGTASGAASTFQKPKTQAKFVEDMTAAEQAQQEGAIPAGLINLGNTCYLNSTLQTLKAIPELQEELTGYREAPSATGTLGSLGDLSQFGLSALGSGRDVTAALRDLYRQMGQTQDGFPPQMFINAFRAAYPQFGELTRDGKGYAQQDAEEAWSQIVTSLKGKLKTTPEATTTATSSDSTSAATSTPSTSKSFIDEFLGGKFEKYEECLEPEAVALGEKKRKLEDEVFYKLNCHVSAREIAHLRDGITAALTDTYMKKSETLDREVEYKATSKISRLPKYLPVHFVRFYWKRDVQKKAKIMRKVTFPHELDVAEYCTDELRGLIVPVRDKIRDLRKEEVDVDRARKRQKRMEKALEAMGPTKDEPSTSKDKKKEDANGDAAPKEGEVFKTDAEIEAEQEARILAAKKELLAAVSPDLAADKTANQTGLYELRGVITHQGASADSGHYTAYVKKEVRMKPDPKTGKMEKSDEDEGKWWWFNDEKVSEVDNEKIEGLAGGGESHSALILLYRAVELPAVEASAAKETKPDAMETS